VIHDPVPASSGASKYRGGPQHCPNIAWDDGTGFFFAALSGMSGVPRLANFERPALNGFCGPPDAPGTARR